MLRIVVAVINRKQTKTIWNYCNEEKHQLKSILGIYLEVVCHLNNSDIFPRPPHAQIILVDIF